MRNRPRLKFHFLACWVMPPVKENSSSSSQTLKLNKRIYSVEGSSRLRSKQIRLRVTCCCLLVACFGLRYQPGLKKANFRNFLFRDVQIKLFKNFHLKKFHKKYSFSAKLLDIEVYYTLIVLITRWQVLSFWGNLSRNKSQGIVVSFYHAIHAARLL